MYKHNMYPVVNMFLKSISMEHQGQILLSFERFCHMPEHIY